MDAPPKPAKAGLRRRARRRLARLDPARVRADSDAILERLRALPAWAGLGVLHTYVNVLPGEVITTGCIDAALAAGARVVVPHIGGPGQPMRHAEIASRQELVPGHWGLLQPSTPRFVDDLSILDVVLVPGLVFDRRGFRVGQGGGYYDRFLAGLGGAVTVGIAFDDSVVDRIPDEAHDVPVQWLVTPSRAHPLPRAPGPDTKGRTS